MKRETVELWRHIRMWPEKDVQSALVYVRDSIASRGYVVARGHPTVSEFVGSAWKYTVPVFKVTGN